MGYFYDSCITTYACTAAVNLGSVRLFLERL